MIDDLRSLAIFDAVADAGSFTGAARRLKLSTSVVSHHIARLEAKLGVSLFFRSTRSMSLTPEGAAIRDAAKRMVAAGEDALDALTDQGAEPTGSLRVTMPAFGAGATVQRALWTFADRCPLVTLSLHGSDRTIDLISEGFDLAIRLGELADSSLKSRKIGTFRRALVAAPSYLKTCAPITSPDDLTRCQFLSYAMLPRQIRLTKGAATVDIQPGPARIEVDNIILARSAVLSGLGVHHLPLSDIAADIAAGRLVEVLPDWSLPVLGIYAVWPDIGPQKKLTRRLIEHLVAEITADRGGAVAER